MTDLLSTTHLCSDSDSDHPYASWPALGADPRGRLVLLTPEITAAAAKEIITGKRLSLDHPIYPSGALLNGRKGASHQALPVGPSPTSRAEAEAQGKTYQPMFDDIVHFNTQASTQWDYFMHYSYPSSGEFYGGLSADEVMAHRTGELGVGAVARAGGVQTRGILLDIPYYLSATGKPPLDPLSFPSSTTIDLPLLQSAIKFFNLTPRVGDVLLVRTGFEEALEEDKIRLEAGGDSHIAGKWAGVQANKATLEWIWTSGFVAVACDNPTFEEWFPEPPAMLFHPILLSGMGIMIGELLRLKELAEECKRQKRWSFFFSSCPLMLDHAVASPPNAVAIF